VVLFAEGGGGRPGDTDMPIVAGLHVPTFASFAALNGPGAGGRHRAGRCFAGNAALLGCCDVIIATRGSNIGMGGPAMVEGGGLGVFRPRRSGPARVQHANGVIDVLVEDEAAGRRRARHYLSFFQGPDADWRGADPRTLRDVVPENRLRVYDSAPRCAAWPTRQLAAGTAHGLRRRHPHRARAHRGPAGRPAWPTTRTTWAARSTPMRPTRPRASCSCATRTACRS
jgi:hypothetical protein